MILFTLKPSWVTSGVFWRPSFEKYSKNHPCNTWAKVYITKSEASIYPPIGESISDRYLMIWTVNKLIVPITLITCSLYNLKKEIIENQQRCHKKHKRFIKKTNNQLDQYWCCKSITIYILNVYHTVSRLFYRYNDIEKNYKKKIKKK